MVNDLELLLDYTSYLKAKKDEGKKIVALMAHDNIPEELFDAVGFVPLKMLFAGNDELMDSSHDYLPPSTCAFAQSCIGLFKLKPSQYQFLELIDYFLLSNHCVSDICASEIITKYFSIPRINFYLPYTQRKESLKYLKLELKDLKRTLEEISGKEISDSILFESIKKYNVFKKKLSEINNLSIKGSKKLEIIQRALLYGPDYNLKLDEFIQNYSSNPSEVNNNIKDILLTGCSIFIGDYLNDLIEESGGNVISFDTWVGEGYFSQILEEDILDSHEDPLDLFVYRYKNNISGDHTIPNSLENKLALIMKKVQEYQQKTGKKLGVINHIIKFCDHMSLQQSTLKKRLRENEIPVLNLERDYSKANRGQLSTRIEAYMEMIKK